MNCKNEQRLFWFLHEETATEELLKFMANCFCGRNIVIAGFFLVLIVASISCLWLFGKNKVMEVQTNNGTKAFRFFARNKSIAQAVALSSNAGQ